MLQFDSATHRYTYNGIQLTSVSQIVNLFKPVFDRDGIAAKTAAKRGKSVDAILAEWDATRDAALSKGTALHVYIEDRLNGYQPVGERMPEMTAWDGWYSQLPSGITFQVEVPVCCPDWGIAGKADCLASKGSTYRLYDWKTGKFNKMNWYGEKLLPPFDSLPNCEWTRYSLQLSLYRLLIERDMGIQTLDATIVHLTEDGVATPHKALDLTAQLKYWLDHRETGQNE